MNFKTFFYCILTWQLGYHNSVIAAALPSEMILRVASHIEPSVEVLPVKRFSDIFNNTAYDDLQLYFPSTSSFRFVKIKENRSFIYGSCPEPAQRNSQVVPSIQCGKKNSYITITDVVSQKTGRSKFLRLAFSVDQLFFDVKGDKAVFLAKNTGYIVIGHSSLSDEQCDYYPLMSPSKTFPRSFCLHVGNQNKTSLIINMGQAHEKHCLMLIFDFADKQLQGKYILPNKIFDFPEMPKVKKHEYIGGETFLLLHDDDLFFCTEEAGREMLFAKQSFFACSKSKLNECSVVSFCVNHDDDKKTPHGRARYFLILAKLKLQDNQEQFIFYVDLLAKHNSFARIWSSKFEQDDKKFDRISHYKGEISLWNDSDQNTDAAIIRLPLNWTDIIENRKLFKENSCEPNFSKNLAALIQEQKQLEAKTLQPQGSSSFGLSPSSTKGYIEVFTKKFAALIQTEPNTKILGDTNVSKENNDILVHQSVITLSNDNHLNPDSAQKESNESIAGLLEAEVLMRPSDNAEVERLEQVQRDRKCWAQDAGAVSKKITILPSWLNKKTLLFGIPSLFLSAVLFLYVICNVSDYCIKNYSY